ncbi:MAG: hypothetical protein LBV47_09365 [Bacteroidales bacterium]|jgi:uncharacterized iron-regulated protein|nr:hypothetical protein [Bacteroidales bacterium]
MKKILLSALIFVSGFSVFAQNADKNKLDSEIGTFFSYISDHGQNPVEYVMNKFKNHYVVALGEDHWIKDHYLFLCDLLKSMDEKGDSATAINVLAWESGNLTDQKLADEFTNSPVYREDLAIKILQHTADTYGWPYLEAVNVFKTVWEINSKKPAAKRIRILLLDPSYMIPYMNKEKYDYTCSRDVSMMNSIQICILQKQRVLFYAGLAHTRKSINGSYMGQYNIYYNYHSAGFLLKTLYPELVCTVKLWGGLMGSNGYVSVPDSEKWERVYNGTIDEAFKKNGNKPVAFDIDKSPFGEVTVVAFYKTSEQTLSRAEDRLVASPYNRNILLKDDIDGIIFFKPVEEFSATTVYGKFFDEEFVKLIKNRTEGVVKTRKQVFELIKKDHPVMSESLDKLIEKENE